GSSFCPGPWRGRSRRKSVQAGAPPAFSRPGWRRSSCSSRSRRGSAACTSSRSTRPPRSWWRACWPAPGRPLPPAGRRGTRAAFATTEEKRDAWVFYTGRFAEEADTPAAIARYLARPGPRQLLIEDELLRTVDRGAFPSLVEVLSGTVAGQGYHLLQKDGPR